VFAASLKGFDNNVYTPKYLPGKNKDDAYVSKNWGRLDVLDIIATFVGGGAGIILIEVLKLIH
jgi:hypothetical protein